MAGAEEVFAAPAARRRRDLRRARAQRQAASSARWPTGADEIHVAYPVTDTFAARNQNTTGRAGRARRGGRSSRAHASRRARHRDARRRRSAARSRGRVDPGLRDRARRAGWPPRAPTRSSSPTRSASACRARCGRSCPRRCARRAASPIGLHLHNTRNTGYANADAGLEAGATLFDASIGGLGGCPFAPARDGQHRHRGPRLPARRRGRGDRRRPRRADRRRRVARAACSAASCRDSCTRPARSCPTG